MSTVRVLFSTLRNRRGHPLQCGCFPRFLAFELYIPEATFTKLRMAMSSGKKNHSKWDPLALIVSEEESLPSMRGKTGPDCHVILA